MAHNLNDKITSDNLFPFHINLLAGKHKYICSYFLKDGNNIYKWLENLNCTNIKSFITPEISWYLSKKNFNAYLALLKNYTKGFVVYTVFVTLLFHRSWHLFHTNICISTSFFTPLTTWINHIYFTSLIFIHI